MMEDNYALMILIAEVANTVALGLAYTRTPEMMLRMIVLLVNTVTE